MVRTTLLLLLMHLAWINVSFAEQITISSVADWQAFANRVNSGETAIDAVLTNDINLGDEQIAIGSIPIPYSGNFDGGSHTLTVNYNTEEKAPFIALRNGSISNLKVRGTLDNAWGCAGLVRVCYGTCRIFKCDIDVNIICRKAESGYSANSAGMVATVQSGCTLDISECRVDGYFEGTSTYARKGWAGFVYNNYGFVTVSNCLYSGSHNIGSGYANTFVAGRADRCNIDNCYYLNPFMQVQGTQVTSDALRDGSVAKLLQADRTSDYYWAQFLGDHPAPFNIPDKMVNNNYMYYEVTERIWRSDHIHIADGTPLPENVYLWASRITNSRILSPNSMYTLCLPYSIQLPGSVKAYRLNAVSTSQQRLYFIAVADNILNRAEPYLIMTGSEPMSLNIDTETYLSTDINATQATESTSTDAFKGTFSGLSNANADASSAYILQRDNLWHKVTTENTSAYIPPYRAYITSSTAGAKALTFALDAQATGMSTIVTTDIDGSRKVYDLKGRSINSETDRLTKGIYVVNRKKIANK